MPFVGRVRVRYVLLLAGKSKHVVESVRHVLDMYCTGREFTQPAAVMYYIKIHMSLSKNFTSHYMYDLLFCLL